MIEIDAHDVVIDIVDKNGSRLTGHLFVKGIDDPDGTRLHAISRDADGWMAEIPPTSKYNPKYVTLCSSTIEGLARRVLRSYGLPTARATLGINNEVRNTEKVVEL